MDMLSKLKALSKKLVEPQFMEEFGEGFQNYLEEQKKMKTRKMRQVQIVASYTLNMPVEEAEWEDGTEFSFIVPLMLTDEQAENPSKEIAVQIGDITDQYLYLAGKEFTEFLYGFKVLPL